jgi:hypothetical protein
MLQPSTTNTTTQIMIMLDEYNLMMFRFPFTHDRSMLDAFGARFALYTTHAPDLT